MNEVSLGKKIVTSAIIAVVAIAIFVGITIVFSMIGIPLWPFVFFMFFFTSIDKFDKSKLWSTAIGGFIGIFVGMSQGMITQLTGNEMIALIIFALMAISLVTMFIMGDVPVVNVFTLLLLTLITLFTSNVPGDWAGFTSEMAGYDMGYIEAFVRICGSYALSVLLFVVVSNVMAKRAAKAVVTDESAS